LPPAATEPDEQPQARRVDLARQDARDGLLAVEGHAVVLVVAAVLVDDVVRDGLAARLVRGDVPQAERHAGGVVGDDPAVPREQEDRDLRVAVLTLRDEPARDDRVRTGLRAAPVPVVHEAHHRGVAPVVVVVADARETPALAVLGDRRDDLALGNRGQPGEQVIVVPAEVEVARLGPPGGHLGAQLDVEPEVVVHDADLVAVAAVDEGGLPDPHVAAVLRSREVGRPRVDREAALAEAGSVELDADLRAQPGPGAEARLGEEGHDEGAAVLEVGVEVPPLVAARSAIGAHAVLPRLDAVRVESEPLIVGGTVGGAGERRHGGSSRRPGAVAII